MPCAAHGTAGPEDECVNEMTQKPGEESAGQERDDTAHRQKPERGRGGQRWMQSNRAGQQELGES